MPTLALTRIRAVFREAAENRFRIHLPLVPQSFTPTGDLGTFCKESN
jgi:hypothetical protein